MALSKPDRWITWLQNLYVGNIDIYRARRDFLKQRDKRFGWTLVHAIFSSNLSTKRCKRIFEILKRKKLAYLLIKRDNDGDTPLHSAIRSKVAIGKVKHLLSQIPSERKKRQLLKACNQKGETPVEMAFEKREWGLFRLLLSECMKYQILPELTGIGERDRNVETLLHRVLQRVDSASTFLRIYLETCNDLNVDVMQGLLAVDKHGETPWYHLMNLPDTDMVIQVLSVALQYGIDINSLYTDETSMSSLLHATYRSYKKGQRDSLVSFLKTHGADSRKLDRHNLIPCERRKDIEVGPDSDPPSPSMPCPNGPLDAAEVLPQVPHLRPSTLHDLVTLVDPPANELHHPLPGLVAALDASTSNPNLQPAVLHDHVTLVDPPANELHHPLPGQVAAVDASTGNPDLRPVRLHDLVALVDPPANELHHPLPGQAAAVDASTNNPDLRPAVLHNHVMLVDPPANELHHPLPGQVAAVDASTGNPNLRPAVLHDLVTLVDPPANDSHPQPLTLHNDILHPEPPILHGQVMAVDASADNPPAQLPTLHSRLGDTTIDDSRPRSHGQVADNSLPEVGEPSGDLQPSTCIEDGVFVSPAGLYPRAFSLLSQQVCDYEQLQPICAIPLPESNLHPGRHQLGCDPP